MYLIPIVLIILLALIALAGRRSSLRLAFGESVGHHEH
jgi:hypothetical protein